eukprot:gnl/TRDRNA2_/TRDRNA2_174464_c3_seq2.p1 gnl/TRDRNA2_/TRDRNA2_174464_c3~~gnl/TRDRNA2_/TRDRNA2_174464_c3_seq2.p1  ORF type:complete len:417 (-),score=89.99 gnl/TRDRNA2_/TRDRNA2_174464_c3_seq2:310-1380(-)
MADESVQVSDDQAPGERARQADELSPTLDESALSGSTHEISSMPCTMEVSDARPPDERALRADEPPPPLELTGSPHEISSTPCKLEVSDAQPPEERLRANEPPPPLELTGSPHEICSSACTLEVRNVAGEQLEIDLDLKDGVRSLKDMIEKTWGIPVFCQKLTVGDAILEDIDEATLQGAKHLAVSVIRCDAEIYPHLMDEDECSQQLAFSTLVRVAEGDYETSIAALLVCLRHQRARVRWLALQALGQVANKDDDVLLARICASLGDQDRTVREAASQALGKLAQGNDKKVDKKVDKTIAAVCSHVLSGDSEVRRSAVEALVEIAGTTNADDIACLLDHQDSKVRGGVRQVLGCL